MKFTFPSIVANQGAGLNLNTSYVIIGGGLFNNELSGKIKDFRFFYNTALTETEVDCYY